MHLYKLEKDGAKWLTKERLFYIMDADKAQGSPKAWCLVLRKKEDK